MNDYKKALAEAQEAVKDVTDTELRKIGFKVVLKQILEGDVGKVPPHTSSVKPAVAHAATTTHPNKTGLGQDELNALFEKKDGETISLKVKPTSAALPEQQQLLAHAIIVGYKALFDKDSVPSLAMVAAAREWNLMDKNFARNIQSPGYIQAKGIKKGVTYSLKPGAIDKIRPALQLLAHGE